MPFSRWEEYTTLVGYSSPPGHDHDDNCRSRTYVCEMGHLTKVSKQASCPTCDWKGTLTCGCHEGEKVAEWPEGGRPATYRETVDRRLKAES